MRWCLRAPPTPTPPRSFKAQSSQILRKAHVSPLVLLPGPRVRSRAVFHARVFPSQSAEGHERERARKVFRPAFRGVIYGTNCI
jgi:hypothetical protein